MHQYDYWAAQGMQQTLLYFLLVCADGSSMLSNFCSEESAWEKICEGTEEHRGNVLPPSADSRA